MANDRTLISTATGANSQYAEIYLPTAPWQMMVVAFNLYWENFENTDELPAWDNTCYFGLSWSSALPHFSKSTIPGSGFPLLNDFWGIQMPAALSAPYAAQWRIEEETVSNPESGAELTPSFGTRTLGGVRTELHSFGKCDSVQLYQTLSPCFVPIQPVGGGTLASRHIMIARISDNAQAVIFHQGMIFGDYQVQYKAADTLITDPEVIWSIPRNGGLGAFLKAGDSWHNPAGGLRMPTHVHFRNGVSKVGTTLNLRNLEIVVYTKAF